MVGTGEKVSVLNHPWLVGDKDPYVSTRSLGLMDKCVSSLFVAGSRQWDVDLVCDMFNNRDVRLILGTPLSPSATNDFWSWQRERTCDFFVRSVYKLIHGRHQVREGANNSNFWRALW